MSISPLSYFFGKGWGSIEKMVKGVLDMKIMLSAGGVQNRQGHLCNFIDKQVFLSNINKFVQTLTI